MQTIGNLSLMEEVSAAVVSPLSCCRYRCLRCWVDFWAFGTLERMVSSALNIASSAAPENVVVASSQAYAYALDTKSLQPKDTFSPAWGVGRHPVADVG